MHHSCINRYPFFWSSGSNPLLFIYFEDKLTHRYYTRVNSARIMEQLEQENQSLRDEVARLGALMEQLLAAQNQPAPQPATPVQRTVISEIATSSVPVSAHQPNAMPPGFP